MKKLVFIIFLFPFFAQAQDKLPDTIEAGWKGMPVCEVLYEEDKIRTGTCTYPPGIGQDRHTHGPYFTYVISGGRYK